MTHLQIKGPAKLNFYESQKICSNRTDEEKSFREFAHKTDFENFAFITF